MAKIEIYSKQWCPYCNKAKALLRTWGLEYVEIDITDDEAGERKMVERSKRQTVPQIFIDGSSIGGYDDLSQLNARGELDRMLEIELKTAPGRHSLPLSIWYTRPDRQSVKRLFQWELVSVQLPTFS